ncbi:type II restriction enzyme [Chryseobacterium oryctis]|uniref:Transcriptional regulator n=1 Tax=Chryseobacterium oryctis TaxID=2952618 RepID=A0ABT3HPT3_9FLAO|nr:hypothetical protein [Chryseobacterium oryctis]MCW3161638.1 hypothetical protein [Chryseobacterium oryctis]
MMDKTSKLNDSWEKIFNKYKILEKISDEGHFNITATEINEFREARLMTKFDHKSQLPKLFHEHDLSILPTSRGGYVIGAFKTFHEFNDDDTSVSKINFPAFLESLDFKNITSEAAAINCAFVSNILQDFVGEKALFPTVSGRMGSSVFDFDINSSNGLFKVNVENSQVEIDGGYEGELSLSIIEAKNYISKDFLVRQLYYPYRLWNERVKKHVRPIFLTYSNGIFHLREYEFTEVQKYNSLVLVQHKKYTVHEGSLTFNVLQELIDKTEIVKEPEIPFPQADSFERVVNLGELLFEKEFISKEDITRNYDFDARQTDYYSNAGKYLGILEIGKDILTGQIGCYLTSTGKRLFNLNIFDRQKEFIKLIIAHSVFKQTLKLALENKQIPTKDDVVEVMMKSNLYNVNSESTYRRRSSTVLGWLNWIVRQIEE